MLVNPPQRPSRDLRWARFTARVTELFEPSQTGKPRWAAMEGLRGFAVALVFLVHYTAVLEPRFYPHVELRGWIDILATAGLCGVDLFFVLSGLLIYRACIQPHFNWRAYAERRVVRIYPTFLAVFALYLSAMLLFPGKSRLPGGAGPDLLYIISNLLFLPGILPILPMITVAWSISYEALFYIFMPLVVIVLRLRRWSSPGRIGCAFVFAIGLIALEGLGWGVPFETIMFAAGIVVYEWGTGREAFLTSSGRSQRVDVLVIALTAVTLFVFGWEDARVWLTADIGQRQQVVVRYTGIGIAFSLLVYRCLFERSTACALFSWRPLRWLGNMSYSFYLFHAVALEGFRLAWKAFAPDWRVGLTGYLLLFPPVFLASVLLTVPLYLWVEKRFSLDAPVQRSAPFGVRVGV